MNEFTKDGRKEFFFREEDEIFTHLYTPWCRYMCVCVYIYFIAIFITFTKTLRETASLNILRCDPAPPRIRNARTTEVNRIQWVYSIDACTSGEKWWSKWRSKKYGSSYERSVPYPFLFYFFPYPLLLLFLRSPLKFDDLSSISLFLLIVAIRFRVRFLMKNNIRKMGWSSGVRSSVLWRRWIRRGNETLLYCALNFHCLFFSVLSKLSRFQASRSSDK